MKKKKNLLCRKFQKFNLKRKVSDDDAANDDDDSGGVDHGKFLLC